MEEWVTVAVFSFPSELAVIRSRLESEGIECLIKDEFTVQIHNFYSNAIGGIKLQVKQSDVADAYEILKEAGIHKEDVSPPSVFWTKFENFTGKIPLIKTVRTEIRVLILAAVILAMIAFMIIPDSNPSLEELLTENTWCVSHLQFEGQDYRPESAGVQLTGSGFCSESIQFRNDGKVVFPGFKTYPVWGEWWLEETILYIGRADTLQHILEGDYSVSVNEYNLILTSAKTTIHCFRSDY